MSTIGSSGGARTPAGDAVPGSAGDAGTTPQPARAGSNARDGIAAGLRRYALAFVGLLLIVLFSLLMPTTFATTENLITILSSQSVLLILTLAVLLPLRAGDFDLSVASVMVFASASMGLLVTQFGVPTPVAALVALAIGAVIGTFNAFFIVTLGINAFIVTLGTLTVLQGLVLGITGSNIIVNLPADLLAFGRTEVFGLPLAIFYGWILAVILYYLFEWTPLGRYLLFVGGNREAARLAGVPVNRTRYIAFIGAGLISSFAGVIVASKFGAIDPTVGGAYLLPPYAAAFLGTTAVTIGRFNVGGAVIAVYLLIVGITGLLLLGAAPWISSLFNGAALLAAVAFAQLAGRKEAAS